MTAVDVSGWIQLIALGGIAGMLGQGARTMVGIKKVGDEAAAQGSTRQELIEPARLFMSLAYGFVAGALTAMSTEVDLKDIPVRQVMGFAAAGYAGADLVEGLIAKFTPPTPATSSLSTTPPGGPPSGPTPPADDYLG